MIGTPSAAVEAVAQCRTCTIHRARVLPGENATPLGAAITWVSLTTDARLMMVNVNSASSKRFAGQTQV